MKNAPVVVIRNRADDTVHLGKYRIRNLLTDEISYSDSVTLHNPVFVDNVDWVANLTAERIQHCDWAVSGSLADTKPKLKNPMSIKTTSFGITFAKNGNTYHEDKHGPLAALHFGNSEKDRFVWLAK